MSACRCGWNGDGAHPCHGQAYRCRQPSAPRFVASLVCLAGVQMKLGAYETHACDVCWAEYQRENAARKGGT